MKLARPALRTVVVAAAGVAVAVAVTQVISGGRWDWRWLAAALLLAIVAGVLDQQLGRRTDDTRPQPALWPALRDSDGKPRPLGDVTLRDLGVHPSRFGADGDCPYIPRAADALLGEALADPDQRAIIVQGPRLAGTTRTLARAARLHLPGHRAAAFTDDPQIPLTDMITQAGRWAAASDGAGAVLWLDAITPARLTSLARALAGELPDRLRILATLDTAELDGSRIPEQAVALLDEHAARVTLTTITRQERDTLRGHDTYAALRPVIDHADDLFLGRLMITWEPLRQALTLGGSEQGTDRVALLRAVTDWYRAHLPRLLSDDVLGYLYRACRHDLTEAAAGDPVSAAGYADALRWATAAPTVGRPRLIDLQAVPGGHRYTPHPLLAVLADDPAEDVAWPVADALWDYADRYFDGDQRRDIGYTALARHAWTAAGRLLDHDGTTIDPAALHHLARHYHQADNPQRSRHWYQQAISSGHPDHASAAMVGLGLLEEEQGDAGQARHWYQQAVSSGHPDAASKAMVNLGNLEDEQGDAGQARHWYQQAIGSGHPDHAPAAMVNLGVLEDEQGDAVQARHWFQQAISSGHPDYAPKAMVNLGILERGQGDAGQARHWYQQAISSGHPDAASAAMLGLGNLEDEQGHAGQARHWYQQAISSGHPDAAPAAMLGLGNLERGQGDAVQARHWYQQAISSGHPDEAPRAEQQLRALDRQQEEQDRARQFGRYGYLAYADPDLMKRPGSNPRPADPASSNPSHDPGDPDPAPQ